MTIQNTDPIYMMVKTIRLIIQIVVSGIVVASMYGAADQIVDVPVKEVGHSVQMTYDAGGPNQLDIPMGDSAFYHGKFIWQTGGYASHVQFKVWSSVDMGIMVTVALFGLLSLELLLLHLGGTRLRSIVLGAMVVIGSVLFIRHYWAGHFMAKPVDGPADYQAVAWLGTGEEVTVDKSLPVFPYYQNGYLYSYLYDNDGFEFVIAGQWHSMIGFFLSVQMIFVVVGITAYHLMTRYLDGYVKAKCDPLWFLNRNSRSTA